MKAIKLLKGGVIGTLIFYIACLLMGLVGGCATMRPEPVEPILSSEPHLATDSVPAPDVRSKRPRYAQSLPAPLTGTGVGQSKSTPAPTDKAKMQGLGRLVPGFLRAKSTQNHGSGTVKDKSQTTINIYNAPEKMKGNAQMQQVTGDGNVANASTEAQKDEKPNQSTHKGVPGWQIMLGIVLVLLGAFAIWRLT